MIKKGMIAIGTQFVVLYESRSSDRSWVPDDIKWPYRSIKCQGLDYGIVIKVAPGMPEPKYGEMLILEKLEFGWKILNRKEEAYGNGEI